MTEQESLQQAIKQALVGIKDLHIFVYHTQEMVNAAVIRCLDLVKEMSCYEFVFLHSRSKLRFALGGEIMFVNSTNTGWARGNRATSLSVSDTVPEDDLHNVLIYVLPTLQQPKVIYFS